MLSKFTAAPPLVAAAAALDDDSAKLEKANLAYEASKKGVIFARVDVKYQDYVTDIGLSTLVGRAEVADGGKTGGPIHSIVAPDGKTPLIKPFGQKQVDVLKDVEGRLVAVAALWPEAVSVELPKIKQFRQDYEVVLKARDEAWQKAKDMRVIRNVARDQFVISYTNATLEVKKLFPRDKTLQELLFDEVEKDQNEPEPDPAPAGATGPTGPSAATTTVAAGATGGTGGAGGGV